MLADCARFLCSDDGDILVVNGYAGTGKTTALAAIVSVLTKMKVHCTLMAPTGRSAKVFSSYAHMAARTVHKCIYRQKSMGEDGLGQFSLLPNKAHDMLFIVDEVSLIGTDDGAKQGSAAFGTGDLLSDLVSFVRNGTDCRLILVGDSAQLPPVGLIESPALSKAAMDAFGGVFYTELTDVVRQASDSGILTNATQLRHLIADTAREEFKPAFKLKGFDDIQRISGGELIETLQDVYGRWGEDETVVLCRSNKRAIRYNLGIRSTVLYREEQLVRGDKLMIVKNCYSFADNEQAAEKLDYIANGDIAVLQRISGYEERFGLHFAQARLLFPDYDDIELNVKVLLDTLESESASLSYEQQNALFAGVSEDYADIKSKRKRYAAVREDPYFNALQLKYAQAVTCHKSQGGQWKCVFIDCPFWQEVQTRDDLKWMYTALTRAVEKVYLVNFPDRFFV
ncbi:MAG: AAA family ATPase [Bacteroidales bacterium]|nr:AAA family ATPase [Bacteroidales bacterium]